MDTDLICRSLYGICFTFILPRMQGMKRHGSAKWPTPRITA